MQQEPVQTVQVKKGQPEFLNALMDGASVSDAARKAGVGRQTVYDWRKADPDFALAWNQAVDIGTDALEDEAQRRGKDGVEEPVYQGGKQVGVVRKYSDTLLIFLLKARRPNIYRERVSAEIGGPDGKPLPAVNAGVTLVLNVSPSDSSN